LSKEEAEGAVLGLDKLLPMGYVKVKALKPNLRKVNGIVRVVEVGEPRVVYSRRDRSEHRVAEALVGDETGCALLNLWDDQIDTFGPDDVFKIKNAYTSLFRGFLRLNLGRYGEVEKVDREVGEVNTENNLSKKFYGSNAFWTTPYRRHRAHTKFGAPAGIRTRVFGFLPLGVERPKYLAQLSLTWLYLAEEEPCPFFYRSLNRSIMQ